MFPFRSPIQSPSVHPRTLLIAGLVALAAWTLPGLLQADTTTTLELSGHAEREVENDRMTVRMQAEARAPQAAEAAAAVNRKMAQALEQAEQQTAVDSRTLDYTTQPIHDREDR